MEKYLVRVGYRTNRERQKFRRSWGERQRPWKASGRNGRFQQQGGMAAIGCLEPLANDSGLAMAQRAGKFFHIAAQPIQPAQLLDEAADDCPCCRRAVTPQQLPCFGSGGGKKTSCMSPVTGRRCSRRDTSASVHSPSMDRARPRRRRTSHRCARASPADSWRTGRRPRCP